MQLVRIENLQTAPREAELVCHPLASIKLEGKIDMTAIPYSRDLEVCAQYVAPWSHPFFGIADGTVMTLDAGTALVEPNGGFVVELPGSNLGSDAYFSLVIRMKTTWNLVALLEADAPLSPTPDGDLRLERAYPTPVRFLARPMK